MSIFGGPSGGGILGGGLQRILDPQVGLPMAAQLMGGRTFQDSLSGAFAAAGPGIVASKKRMAINDWLKAGAPKDVQHPATIAMFEAAPEVAEKYLGNQFGVGAGKGFGDTPIYLNKLGPDGKPIGGLSVGRFNADGGVTVATPDGYAVADRMTYLNTGDNFVPAGSRTGVEGPAAAGKAPVPINNEAPAFGAAVGKGKGEATVDLHRMEANMPGLEVVVKELGGLGDKATYTEAGKWIDAAGRQLGAEPRDSAIARREYMAMVDNQVLPLLRQTFGAAFTEKEGTSLKATLGDPDLSPKEKRAVIKAFIKQKRRDVAAMAAQAGQPAPAPVEDTTDVPVDPFGIR